MNQAHSQPTNCAHNYYDENDSTKMAAAQRKTERETDKECMCVCNQNKICRKKCATEIERRRRTIATHNYSQQISKKYPNRGHTAPVCRFQAE